MKEKAHDIYPYTKDLERAKQTLRENAKIYDVDKQTTELVEEFIEHHIMSNGLKVPTNSKFLYDFARMMEWFEQPLLSLNEKEMVSLCKRIRGAEDIAERTKEDYFVKLKQFYRYVRLRIRKGKLEGGAELGDAIEYLLDEYRFRLDKDKMPKASYLVEDDVIKLIDATLEPSHKTLFSLLWATGCRIGEVLTLRISDVKPLSNGLSNKGFMIELRKSKTTERTIPVLDERRVNATRFLRVWLQQRRRDGAGDDDTLFVNSKGEPVQYRAAKKWLDRAGKAASLGKRVHFHAIRKGRATDLAEKGWSGPQMNQVMGWRHGSRMPSVYIQRAGVDITRQMAEDYGLVDVEETSKDYRVCVGCGTENNPDKEFCMLCSRPIGDEALAAEQRYVDDLVKERSRTVLNQLRSELGLPLEE